MATKKNLKIYIPLAIVILLVLTGGIYWYIDYISYVNTDDAYVTSDVVTVSPKIMGRISKIYAEEGDTVKAGELLAELDSTDLLAQKQQIIAAKAQTEAGKVQAEAKYDFDVKNAEVMRIGLEKAKDDYARAQKQFAGGVLTQEQFDHIQKGFETAQAQYTATKTQFKLSRSQIKSSEAAVASAEAQIHVIDTQLRNTRLYAPASGVIAKRWLLAGDIANPGQSVFTINNNSKFWVMVYLEETKMEALKIGQPAKFTLDTYPSITFTGKIFMLGSTTASQFSLIPPSNASGNFTKVTQRVPVKISIDGIEDGRKLQSYHLMTGMSAIVKIVK
ncbi:MAG: HlyD family secretion protein [Paludibacter sp.]|nr:HlyD family secretion protein [Paludibacter sp.]